MLKEAVIKVPEKMIMYLNMSDPRDELERNAMILYPYIRNNTMSHGKAAESHCSRPMLPPHTVRPAQTGEQPEA